MCLCVPVHGAVHSVERGEVCAACGCAALCAVPVRSPLSERLWLSASVVCVCCVVRVSFHVRAAVQSSVLLCRVCARWCDCRLLWTCTTCDYFSWPSV